MASIPSSCSSSSSSFAAQLLVSLDPPPSVTISLSALNRLVRRILQAKKIHVRGLQELESTGIHPRYRLTLSGDASPSLLLTLPPRPHVKLLRIEQRSLESEVQLYQLLSEHTNVPVPQILAYDFTPKTLRGTPFLLTTDIPGSVCSVGAAAHEESQRSFSANRLPSLKTIIGQLTSPLFGPLHRVFGQEDAANSWRQVFNFMLEGVLRDGEDMFISLPYEAIRSAFDRFSGALDSVQEARLLLLGPTAENRRIDLVHDENEIDMVDWLGCGGWILWGDPLLATVFDASLNGLEIKSFGPGNETAKTMLYIIFCSVLIIVEENYRPRAEKRDLDARKNLTSTFKHLQGVKKGVYF